MVACVHGRSDHLASRDCCGCHHRCLFVRAPGLAWVAVITWAVMAHPSRRPAAEALAGTLGATVHFDAGGGENSTGDAAWSACPAGSAWHVVVQDDAVPVPDVAQEARKALSEAPTGVVGLYYGTNYPASVARAATAAGRRADETGAAWLVGRRLCWGVAVAVRADLVPAMLRAVAGSRVPYDRRLAHWAITHGLPVAYTWPSLFDHADGPTLTGRPRPKPRRAHRVGSRPTWAAPTLALPF